MTSLEAALAARAAKDAEYRERHRQSAERSNKKKRSRPGSYRKEVLKRHGLTVQQYESLLAKQGGVCAICHRPDPGREGYEHLHVDHDHATGLVRGLLCHGCNTALGFVGDEIETLRSMVRYLERHVSATAVTVSDR